MQDNSEFYLQQPEPQQSCLLALRSIILNLDDDLNETRKYGMPCFCLGKRAVCYLWMEKKTKHPYILFVEGKRLDHPLLEAGDRARMKILTVAPDQDIPIDAIQSILLQAIDLFRNPSKSTSS